jgi:hypothetical protein
MARRRSIGPIGGRIAVATNLALAITPILSADSPGAETNHPRAVLDGRGLALDEVGRFACHDRDFPLIRCFHTAAERDLDVQNGGVLDGD